MVKEAKDGETQKLRNRVRRLDQENKSLQKKVNKLLSENGTLQAALDETERLLKEHYNEVSLDEALRVAKKAHQKKKLDKKRKSAKELCPECGNHEVKLIPSRAGTIIVCSKCEYRGVKKK